MRFSLAIASACILACIALANAQQPLPPNMQIVQLQDLSQARKDLASAFVNMSFYKRAELREDVMFAGGDYAREGCSVSEVTDLYISVAKGQPQRSVMPISNLSQARANLAGAGLSWPVDPSTGFRQPGYFAFAGGLTCNRQTGTGYKASDVIDIFWYDASKESPSVSPWTLAKFDAATNPVQLSSGRNWMSATTFCTLTRSGGSKPTPVCRFMFAGGQGKDNQYSNVVDILDASRCYTGDNKDPSVCMSMTASIVMNIARGSLAVASFVGSGSVGGGAAMFAGGKTETTDNPPLPIPWGTSDFYVSASATSPILDLLYFNLSVPRFDLAGVGFDISGTGKQQALFAGGTTADKNASDVVDAFLFGGAIPDVYTFQMSQPRTRPQLGQLGNRYAVVAAGSTCIEYQPIDPNDPRSQVSQFCCGATNIDIFDLQGASSTTPPTQTYRADLPQQPAATCNFQQLGSNCGVCDLSSASMDGWFVMAGGQWSLNASDPDKVELPLSSVYAVQYTPLPDPPSPTPAPAPPGPPGPPINPPPNNAADSSSAAQYNAAVLSTVIIFFLTWGGNLFGVYFYCRENGLNFLPSTTALPKSFFASPLVFAFFLHGFVWIWLIKVYSKGKSTGSTAFHATLL